MRELSNHRNSSMYNTNIKVGQRKFEAGFKSSSGSMTNIHSILIEDPTFGVSGADGTSTENL